jgi:hypothetical protein
MLTSPFVFPLIFIQVQGSGHTSRGRRQGRRRNAPRSRNRFDDYEGDTEVKRGGRGEVRSDMGWERVASDAFNGP